MNIFLLSLQALGGLWLILLFGFCFLGVHIAKLAKLGWSQSKKTPPPKPEAKQEPPKEKQAPKAEPVYYIVERKKRPPKNTYGEPKPFQFKK